jgi:hypothetical protein
VIEVHCNNLELISKNKVCVIKFTAETSFKYSLLFEANKLNILLLKIEIEMLKTKL